MTWNCCGQTTERNRSADEKLFLITNMGNNDIIHLSEVGKAFLKSSHWFTLITWILVLTDTSKREILYLSRLWHVCRRVRHGGSSFFIHPIKDRSALDKKPLFCQMATISHQPDDFPFLLSSKAENHETCSFSRGVSQTTSNQCLSG